MTAPSLTTVSAMLSVVTQIGLAKTDAMSAPVLESFVVEFASDVGGVTPALRYRARAAAAWASR